MVDLRSLSLKHLRALAAAVRTGSITQAADQLSVTPPAVATHLKTMENLVGAPIVERGEDGLRATALGRELLLAAHEIDHVIARAATRLAALRAGAAGSLALGVVSTGKYFAPSLVAAFGRAHAQIDVKLIIGNRQAILAGLENAEFDVTVMGRPPGHLDLDRFVIGDHPHIIIAPPDHPLVDDPDILPEDLLTQTFLAREVGSGTRLLMERYLERFADGRPFRVVEMGTNETIKQAVMAGLGVALISAHTCLAELRERRLAAIQAPGLPLVRQWFALRRADRPASEAASAFWSFLRDAKESALPRL